MSKTFTTFEIIYFDPILKNKFGDKKIDDFIKKSIDSLFKEIPRVFTKCCYTLEITHENNFHWQMRAKVGKSKTLNSFVKHLDTTIFKDAKVQITAKENINNFSYCLKKDVSKYGNHSYLYKKGKFSLLDDTTNELQEIDIDKFIPKKFDINRVKLYDFQESIIKIIKDETNIHSSTWDDRLINYVYQVLGNCGKSTLLGLLKCNFNHYNINVIDLPAFNDYKLLMEELYQQASIIGKRDNYAVFLDFPKALNKERIYQIYSAIEKAKEGLYSDGRYQKNEWFINCPSIWIFSNNPPDLDSLSLDRWKLWTISGEKKLKLLTERDVYKIHFEESLKDKNDKILLYSLEDLLYFRDLLLPFKGDMKVINNKLKLLKISSFESLNERINLLQNNQQVKDNLDN